MRDGDLERRSQGHSMELDGYIIGPKIAGTIFAGGVFSWLSRPRRRHCR